MENITRVTEPPRDFACEYFQIREYAKSLEARGARGGGGMPVYNKAQYPRISLSCIFNDFLGDFGRSTERGGWKKKEKRKRKLGPQERKLRKLESLKPNYIYLPPRRTLLDRVLYCINHFLPFLFLTKGSNSTRQNFRQKQNYNVPDQSPDYRFISLSSFSKSSLTLYPST